MKERPIIFNSEMVRAILDSRKTQTRRVIKNPEKLEGLMLKGEASEWCPYGKIGDRLWVRETFMAYNTPKFKSLEEDLMRKPLMIYRATDKAYKGEKWKLSIFMPQRYSRIDLEITDIRVERVQDISERDAIAEGVIVPKALEILADFYGPTAGSKYIVAFRDLWDSINAKRGYGWDKNPYCWVIEFKDITGRE